MKIKGTRIPYRLVDGYVEEYGEGFKKELLNDYPYISQEQLDDYLINLYEQNKRYREALEFYADEETYEPSEVQVGAVTKEGYKILKYKYNPIINTDKGKTARKALEDQSEQ